MHWSLSDIMILLEHYKYLVIVPIAIIEGPIIIIITGFLVSLGYLSGVVAYPVLVLADMFGDCLYYAIGRGGRNSKILKKYGKFIGYNENTATYLENHFQNHKMKTFLMAKISHGIGGIVQISSGIANVKFSEFLEYSFIGTVPKTVVLMFVGFYIGKYYIKIDGLLHYIALFTLSITVLAFLYIISRKFSKEVISEDK